MNLVGRMTSRWLSLVATSVIAAVASMPIEADAQERWPARPIKLIVPFAAGGSTDVVARLIATKLGTRLGQPVVVDYKSGAGGTIGADFVAKSPADGYTLLLGSTTLITAAAIGNKLPCDTQADLLPIGQVGTTPLVIVVAKDSRFTTLRELIDEARSKPNAINYGSGGVGSMSHLGMELFAAEAGIRMLHVPYKGVSVAFNDLLGGNLQTTISASASVAPLIEGGKLRPLAVTSPQRSKFMTGLPTVAEAGRMPDFQIEFWWGILGPARLPPTVVQRLNDELRGILMQPDVQDTLAREATVARSGTPESLGQLIAFDLARWRNLVKDAGIKSE